VRSIVFFFFPGCNVFSVESHALIYPFFLSVCCVACESNACQSLFPILTPPASQLALLIPWWREFTFGIQTTFCYVFCPPYTPALNSHFGMVASRPSLFQTIFRCPTPWVLASLPSSFDGLLTGHPFFPPFSMSQVPSAFSFPPFPPPWPKLIFTVFSVPSPHAVRHSFSPLHALSSTTMSPCPRHTFPNTTPPSPLITPMGDVFFFCLIAGRVFRGVLGH